MEREGFIVTHSVTFAQQLLEGGYDGGTGVPGQPKISPLKSAYGMECWDASLVECTEATLGEGRGECGRATEGPCGGGDTAGDALLKCAAIC